jgi:hypothetical protein
MCSAMESAQQQILIVWTVNTWHHTKLQL